MSALEGPNVSQATRSLPFRATPRLSDAETVAFLQWSLPRLGLRWPGFRKVRGTVRTRLVRRMEELGAVDIAEYRARLEAEAGEWSVLDAMCRIPVSWFHRDRGVFDRLGREVLPERARAAARSGRTSVRVWSAGCASGEEPYTIAILWYLDVAPREPGVELAVLATDVDETMIARAARGSYAEEALRELPPRLRAEAFRRDGGWCVREDLRRGITFRREDLRAVVPDGPFDVILCRNAAFTYFDDRAQRAIAEKLVDRLLDGGVLVLGCHERLPRDFEGLSRRAPCIYERGTRSSTASGP